jgi:hypothetical protein
MFKYGPLLVALLLLFGFIPQVIRDHPQDWPEIQLDLTLPLIISLLLLAIFLKIKNWFKYVAIGRTKIIIKKKGQEYEHTWLDVEWITLNRFLGLYELKIKNEDKIYFTPYGRVSWLTGDESDMGVIITKMKHELSI